MDATTFDMRESSVMTAKIDTPPIWEAFCTAVGTEFRDDKEIRGASGLVHPVEAVGVDDNGKRVVLVSAEFNPRIAALMRIDVQATLPDTKVLVARPLALDLGHVARKMFFTETGVLDINRVLPLAELPKYGDKSEEFWEEFYGDSLDLAFGSVARSNISLKTHFFSFIEQISSVNWDELFSVGDEKNYLQIAVNTLTKFSEIDNLAADMEHGICPIPTYELTEDDWDLFGNPKNIDEVQSRLTDMSIYQYFYPPADSLALGLIDSGKASQEEIEIGMNVAEATGHNISESALLSDASQLPDILDGLSERGYILEGEFTNELTEEGKLYRQSVSVRPSESLFHKLSQLMSLKMEMNLKDLFPPK